MGELPRLELMRVACNRLRAVPDSFAGLDALAWFSLGGNPACAHAPPARCPAASQPVFESVVTARAERIPGTCSIRGFDTLTAWLSLSRPPHTLDHGAKGGGVVQHVTWPCACIIAGPLLHYLGSSASSALALHTATPCHTLTNLLAC